MIHCIYIHTTDSFKFKLLAFWKKKTLLAKNAPFEEAPTNFGIPPPLIWKKNPFFSQDSVPNTSPMPVSRKDTPSICYFATSLLQDFVITSILIKENRRSSLKGERVSPYHNWKEKMADLMLIKGRHNYLLPQDVYPKQDLGHC